MQVLSDSMKVVTIVIMLLLFFLPGCDGDSDNKLASYAGERPLSWEQITQGYVPDIQWLGGRVAAVGVNRGPVAALDSSLIWVKTMESNDINSYITYGMDSDTELLSTLGAVPQDSLENEETYTFWLADKDAFDAALDSNQVTNHSFIDSTITLGLAMNGRIGGQRNLITDFTVTRERTLLGERLHLTWEPSTVGFQQLVFREGTNGEYTNRLYHVWTRDDTDTIFPPFTIGDGDTTNLLVAFDFVPFSIKKGKSYFLWMSTRLWTEGNFSSTAYGYATYGFYKIKN